MMVALAEPRPHWGHSPYGNHRYWTRQRVLTALQIAAAEIECPLPCSDRRWNVIKRGRSDWPPATRVLDYFGAMARAWLAAGADRMRITLHNIGWTAEEDAYLLEHAGFDTLKSIAAALGRTYQAVRVRIGSKGFGITARANQGFLSAAEIAREYRAPYHRVRELLSAGTIRGWYDKRRNAWRVDPARLTKTIVSLLTAPKRTYKSCPPDVGDYYRRYGIRRSCRNPAHIMSANPPERSQHGKGEGNAEEGPTAAL